VSKNLAKREYFFGAHDEHRVEFTIGRDLILQPQQRGEPLNYFVYMLKWMVKLLALLRGASLIMIWLMLPLEVKTNDRGNSPA